MVFIRTCFDVESGVVEAKYEKYGVSERFDAYDAAEMSR